MLRSARNTGASVPWQPEYETKDHAARGVMVTSSRVCGIDETGGAGAFFPPGDSGWPDQAQTGRSDEGEILLA
jgi:hypothetical protein